jgi:hypothetical protein
MYLWLFFGLCLLVSGTSFSLLVTGDVNLNVCRRQCLLIKPSKPKLPEHQLKNFTFIWGDMLPVLRGADILAINHESTIASIQDNDPDVIQVWWFVTPFSP